MLPTTHGEQPFRILLVDRSEETRNLFATLFLGMGYEVKTVTTGTEALAWASVFRPHAVFSAIRLPDQSGFDLCMALRRLPETASALIVAISGFLSPDAAARAAAAGFDQYLVKPVKLDTILATLHAINRSEGATATPTETSSIDTQAAH